IKTSQIIARRGVDVQPTIRKSAPASIESLGQIGDRSAEVTQYPLDVRVSFGNSGKDKLRGRESRVEKKSDERHQPVVRHSLDADWIGWMNVQYGAKPVRFGVERIESRVCECDAVY